MSVTNVFFYALPILRGGCPFSGYINLLNFTLSGEMFKFSSKGVLKLSLHFFNDHDKMILGLTYIYAKTSTWKMLNDLLKYPTLQQYNHNIITTCIVIFNAGWISFSLSKIY